MRMDYSPKPLPVGLSGVNNGFSKAAGSLRRFWTKREYRGVHETDMSYPPDQFTLEKRTPTFVPDSPTISSTTITIKNTTNDNFIENCNDESSDMDLDSNDDFNEINQATDNNSKVIEELGAVLKSRGMLPTNFDCKDAKSILDAIQSNTVNQRENIIDDNNSEDAIQNTTTNTHNNSTSCAEANVFDILPEHSLQQASSNETGENTDQYMPTKASPNVGNEHQNFTQGVQNTLLCSIPLLPSQLKKQLCKVVRTSEPTSPQRHSLEHENTKIENKDGRNRMVEDTPKRCSENQNNLTSDRGSNQKSKPARYPRLVFRNLPPGVSGVELAKKMREVGDLLYCEGPHDGLAVVAFSNLQDAERCLRLFHRSKVDGQVIDVMLVSK